MDQYVENIYNMLYSPILTPYDLIENAKLDNYNYVKYVKGESGLIVEMQCQVMNEGLKTFYYSFDEKDYLQEIRVDTETGQELLFERQKEVEKLKESYNNAKLFNLCEEKSC